MIKLKVLKQFHDKVTDELYKADSVIEVTEERAKEILDSPLKVAELVEGEKLETRGKRKNKVEEE